ncbi:MAG: hypothetical protein ACKOZY_07775, partial [Flavobacteriales bacterium]
MATPAPAAKEKPAPTPAPTAVKPATVVVKPAGRVEMKKEQLKTMTEVRYSDKDLKEFEQLIQEKL